MKGTETLRRSGVISTACISEISVVNDETKSKILIGTLLHRKVAAAELRRD